MRFGVGDGVADGGDAIARLAGHAFTTIDVNELVATQSPIAPVSTVVTPPQLVSFAAETVRDHRFVMLLHD